MPMNRLAKWMLGIGLTIWAVFFVTALVIYFYYDAPCGNETLSVSVSPNGDYQAVSFRRNCGATTSSSIQVSVLPAGIELGNEPGNVMVIRESDMTPELLWRGPYDLEVLYPVNAQMSRVEVNAQEVAVEYTPVVE